MTFFNEVSSSTQFPKYGVGYSFKQDALHGRLVDVHYIKSKASDQREVSTPADYLVLSMNCVQPDVDIT